MYNNNKACWETTMSIWTIYFLIGGLLAIITFIDATQRKMGSGAFIWGGLVLLFWPLTRGLFQARKPLRSREKRHGGAAWQVVRTMILWWTIFMVVLSV